MDERGHSYKLAQQMGPMPPEGVVPTRAAKRGYAGIMATERISKLHKDAADEANNVIIPGRP